MKTIQVRIQRYSMTDATNVTSIRIGYNHNHPHRHTPHPLSPDAPNTLTLPLILDTLTPPYPHIPLPSPLTPLYPHPSHVPPYPHPHTPYSHPSHPLTLTSLYPHPSHPLTLTPPYPHPSHPLTFTPHTPLPSPLLTPLLEMSCKILQGVPKACKILQVLASFWNTLRDLTRHF